MRQYSIVLGFLGEGRGGEGPGEVMHLSVRWETYLAYRGE